MKSSLFLCGALALLAPASFAANAKVCFEAEKPAAIVSPLQKVMGKGAVVSSGGYLEIPWDQNKTKGIGSATYKFNVKTAGTYYIWARTFWANGCGNSVEASVNGSDGKILGEDGTYDAWHWVGGRARVALKAGTNTLTLKNRETGVRVDQFFLCQDGDYAPTGIRKITK
ncbi:hypothetical protein B1R32_11742 [Abditibacterium utsteinense]|uniref:Carbohydrate binding module (Family 6) n=1 Tax=Abditibacterium utsteinense TaxID=1960156 RepID=A0A2S8SQD2_9BACT|nr:hypothetical protein [Abditibacterium utsteinense]PQV63000.1 hypothetical protein B1R32_11742 [Abditibacterium utsteinense]